MPTSAKKLIKESYLLRYADYKVHFNSAVSLYMLYERFDFNDLQKILTRREHHPSMRKKEQILEDNRKPYLRMGNCIVSEKG